MSDPFLKNRYPRLTLKGYRSYKGSTYPMTATISLLGDVCTIQRQIHDSLNRFKAMHIRDMYWYIKEQELDALQAVFTKDQSPTVTKETTLFVYPLTISRNEFRLYGRLRS